MSTMVVRTRLNVTLYIYCLSCWKYQHQTTTFPIIQKYKCYTLQNICRELTVTIPVKSVPSKISQLLCLPCLLLIQLDSQCTTYVWKVDRCHIKAIHPFLIPHSRVNLLVLVYTYSCFPYH